MHSRAVGVDGDRSRACRADVRGEEVGEAIVPALGDGAHAGVDRGTRQEGEFSRDCARVEEEDVHESDDAIEHVIREARWGGGCGLGLALVGSSLRTASTSASCSSVSSESICRACSRSSSSEAKYWVVEPSDTSARLAMARCEMPAGPFSTMSSAVARTIARRRPSGSRRPGFGGGVVIYFWVFWVFWVFWGFWVLGGFWLRPEAVVAAALGAC